MKIITKEKRCALEDIKNGQLYLITIRGPFDTYRNLYLVPVWGKKEATYGIVDTEELGKEKPRLFVDPVEGTLIALIPKEIEAIKPIDATIIMYDENK